MSRHLEITAHHILPRSRGGETNQQNIIKLDKSLHQRLHTFFQNATFTEQLLEILTISEKALNKNLVDELYDILNRYAWDEYEKDVGNQKGVWSWTHYSK